jgi:4-carboxymuconolactone decarboxylase
VTEYSKSRIPVLKRSEWTDAARDVFAVIEGPDAWEDGPRFDIVSILAQHPALTRPFLTYNKHLMMNSTVPHRERELVTLYVAWTCKSDYEWLSHVRESRKIGFSDAEIEAVKLGPDAPLWSGLDRTLLRTVDQMRDAYSIDDVTWAELSAHYDHKQMMDLVFTIGNYIMFAAVLNGLRIQPEVGEGGAALAEKYGTP